MLKKEVAVEIMKHLCDCPNHGYSQYARYGDGTTETINIGGINYNIKGGDRDCSSAVIDAFESAGISCGGATYTGNMINCMCSTGNFVWHEMSSGYIAQAGDVYLNIVNHTAMCTCPNPDLLAEFCISENGGISGQVGDQTGYEAYVHGYYDYPWDGILECVNTENADGTNASGDYEPIYTPPTQSGGWLEYVTGYDWNDYENGWAGDDREIDAVEIFLYSPDGTKEIKYQVSKVNGDYYDWQIDNMVNNSIGLDGYAGEIGESIDRLRAYVPDSDIDVFYAVKTANSGMLAEVKNLEPQDGEDFAGTIGEPITGVAVRVSQGSVKYKVHIK